MIKNGASTHIMVRISPGELFDKIGILELKMRFLTDPSQRSHIQESLFALGQAGVEIPDTPKLKTLIRILNKVNERLWNIEDEIRGFELKKDFGPDFISLARSVYKYNDVRAHLKRRIDFLLGSPLVEEKSYSASTKVSSKVVR